MFGYFFPDRVIARQDRGVVVRVWLPRTEGVETTAKMAIAAMLKERRANIGHVSLEVLNEGIDNYVSLWPAAAISSPATVMDARYMRLEADESNEGGEPDLKVSLYSLDTMLIRGAFKDIKEGVNGYVLMGDKCVVRVANRDRKGQSCCGLVYELLRIGGIKSLERAWLPWSDSLDYTLAVTPDNFAEYIKDMKDSEVKLCPETLQFPTIPGEYVPQPVQSSGCGIM
jgi:hypothetical protein